MEVMAKPGPKPGPAEDRKSAIVSLRTTEASRDKWRASCTEAKLSLNEWAIRILDREADKKKPKK